MALTTEDRLDIAELFARYSRYVDRNQADDWLALFLPEGSFEIVGVMKLDGTEQLAGMPAMLAQQSGGRWRHQITDLITEAGPDENSAIAVATGLITDWNRGTLVGSADYRAGLRRVNGNWRIATLRAEMLTAPTPEAA
jgi:hypothetical protein